MKRLIPVLCLLFLSIITQAQSYTYLGVNEGLSHRHVYSIQKDSKGYMWFLTYEGADRFNGAEFKHYNFFLDGHKLNSSTHLKNLFYSPDNILWQIGSDGKVFQYNNYSDKFELFYTYPNESNETTILDFSDIDENNRIWMAYQGNLHIYNYQKRKEVSITQHPLYAATSIEQLQGDSYAIGTTHGVFLAEIRNDSLQLTTNSLLIEKLPMRIEQLYYHKESNSLIIATLRQGLFIYDIEKGTLSSQLDLQTTSVNKMTHYNEDEILVATNGAGVFLLNVTKQTLQPYIIADYDSPNGMNGNNIKDIFLDESDRIWMANYPEGITIRNNQNMNYEWIRHIPKHSQSLIHDEVNCILEDKDGDLWFATTNGISLYHTKTDRWESYLSSYNQELTINNHMFISLCEVSPGIIWVGGYNSGVYEINKHTHKSKLLLSNQLQQINQPDKCIRAIVKDKDNSIWVGAYYNLKQINIGNERIRYFNDLNSITTLVEKDASSIWVASAKGLYILEKKSGNSRKIDLPIISPFVHTLHQDKTGNLYIGTNEGLLIFDPKSGTFKHFHKENSFLISNIVRSIVTDKDDNFAYLATDKGLSKLNLEDLSFQNWTKDQGLLTTFFSGNAGIQLKNGDYLFGSANGVVRFGQNSKVQSGYNSKMILEELIVNQQVIHPTDNNTVLNAPLNEVDHITLKFKENNVSIKVGSINYDYPSNILYTWKMDGLYDKWSLPTEETKFNFTNLNPGTYKFTVRAIPRDNSKEVLEERVIHIEVLNPYWWNVLAKTMYLLIIVGLLVLITRYFIQRSEKKLVDHTKQFYYNTAHDIKVPLRLIKEPLQEIHEKEQLSPNGLNNLRVVLRNLNTLLAQNDNVINYERMEKNKNKLYLSEHNLSHLVDRIIKQTLPIAELKQVSIKLENTLEEDLLVWIDKDKIKAIFNNLLNNAIEKTPDFKSVKLQMGMDTDSWFFEVNHEGDLIPEEQLNSLKDGKCLDDAIYGNTEAQKELGLRLVCQLVKVHNGTVSLDSNKESGTTFRVNLPFYHKSMAYEAPKEEHKTILKLPPVIHRLPILKKGTPINHKILNNHDFVNDGRKPTVLLAEDDATLQAEIINNLSDDYIIETAKLGHDAIHMAKELRPDIIISRMYFQDMKGTELSLTLKGDIETSHIPIILLTDKNDEKHILKGLQNGADEYILKPFNYRILKASMANLLANRALLRDKYASLEIQEPIDCIHCSTNLDWKFIATVKEKVEEHMSEADFTVDKLCAILNMSRTSFYNKLKDLTNKTPSDYIRLIKLNHAALLLKSQEFTIAEIAEKTGFNDAKYFREVFKKHYNMTPSKYAKENS